MASAPPKKSPLQMLSPVKINTSGSSSAISLRQNAVALASLQGYACCAFERSLQKRLRVKCVSDTARACV